MNSIVYDKTDKGREEIATRKYQVPARVRTLLLLVDGRRPLEWLLSNVAGLGLTAQHVEELHEQGYIAVVASAAPAAVPPPAVSVATNVETMAAMMADSAELQLALQEFYSRSIKASLGLRGMLLQMKVEKAASVQAMRELRTPFLEAVIKAKGSEVAIAMRDELDALLGGPPENDEVVMPAPGEAAHGAFDFFNMSSGAIDY